jgi:tetratricopeptide (TPR) repeat protein
MALPVIRLFVVANIAVAMMGCSFFGKNNQDSSGQYYEASYNDRNRAPASLNPPSSIENDKGPLDPLHLRTQADYYFAKGEALSYEGRSQEAAEAFKTVLIYDPESTEVQLRLASEYLKSGQPTLALEIATVAAEKSPKNIEAKLMLGGIYSTLKTYAKAKAQYLDVLKLDPNNNDAPMYLGAIFAEEKQFAQAVKYFEKLAKNDKYETPHLAWYYIGRIRAEMPGVDSSKLAIKAFEQALLLKPGHTESAFGKASVLLKENKTVEALAFLKKFQAEQGPSLKIAEILAQMFIEKEEYEEAYAQLEILEHNSDDPLGIKLRMALILIEKKQFKQAIEKLSDIVRLAPDSDKIRFYLAAVYQEIGDSEKAIEHFAHVPPESQFFTESTVYSIHLYRQLNDSDKALKVAKKAISEKADSPQLHGIYASLLDELGETQKAYEHLIKIEERFSQNTSFLFYLGTVSDKVGEKEKTISIMEKVISLDPNHIQGMNYLAYTLAELNSDLEKAEKLAKKATQLSPKDPYILDTYGWVLFKQGKTEEAIRILEVAQKIKPNEAIFSDHLADAYFKNNMPGRARKYYEIAATTEKNKEKIQQIREKITALQGQELYKNVAGDKEAPKKRLPASIPAPVNLIPGK